MLKSASAIAMLLALVTAAAASAQDGQPGEAKWSRVRNLEPGKEITVTVAGSQPVRRLFVSADDSALTLLDLSDPTLPASAVRALRDMVSQRRGYLEGAVAG